MAMASGARVLAEAYPGRFVLATGVSHAPNIATRGHERGEYVRPFDRMRRYLEAMDRVTISAPAPADPPPRMLRLAAERTLGAHPFLGTVEHTARAREVLGPDPVLAPVLAVVLETDPDKARAAARSLAAHPLERENYRRHLMALGFTEADFAGGGSDRLLDAIVAWGDVDTIAARVQAHHDAGADHVAVNVLTRADAESPVSDLRRLAPALFG